MQYNGKSGWLACEHPGESCGAGDGHNRVSRMLFAKPEVKTAQRMDAQAITSELNKALTHIKGVKGISIDSKIPLNTLNNPNESYYYYVVARRNRRKLSGCC